MMDQAVLDAWASHASPDFEDLEDEVPMPAPLVVQPVSRRASKTHVISQMKSIASQLQSPHTLPALVDVDSIPAASRPCNIHSQSIQSTTQGAQTANEQNVRSCFQQVSTLVDVNASVFKNDAHATSIVDDISSRHGVWLSAGTVQEHARRLSVDRKKLLKTAELLAISGYLAYTYMMQRAIASIIEHVKARDGVCKTFYIFIRYDETPMKMTVLDTEILYGMDADLQAKLKDILPDDAFIRDAGWGVQTLEC